MDSGQGIFRVAFIVLILLAGVSLGLAWWKWGHPRTATFERLWSAFNIGSLALITTLYLYFVIGLALVFSPWRNSFEQWLLFRHEYDLIVADIPVGVLVAVLVLWGRGVARMQIAWAAILFTLMSFVFFAASLGRRIM